MVCSQTATALEHSLAVGGQGRCKRRWGGVGKGRSSHSWERQVWVPLKTTQPVMEDCPSNGNVSILLCWGYTVIWKAQERWLVLAGAYPESSGETSTALRDKSSIILQKQKQKLNKWCSLSLQTGVGGIVWSLVPAQMGLAKHQHSHEVCTSRKPIGARMSCSPLCCGFACQTSCPYFYPEAQCGAPH